MIHSSSPAPKRPRPLPGISLATADRGTAAPRKRTTDPRVATRKGPKLSAARALDAYMASIADASPMELVELERRGVEGVLLRELARRMGITSIRLFAILGLPKATADKKAAAGERVVGSAGQAAIGVVKLNSKARAIVDNSTSPEAEGFDASLWLGRWIEVDQPALGGRKPADLLDTPTGQKVVSRLLGALESGAYQ